MRDSKDSGARQTGTVVSGFQPRAAGVPSGTQHEEKRPEPVPVRQRSLVFLIAVVRHSRQKEQWS